VDEDRAQATDLGVHGKRHGRHERGGAGRQRDANLNAHGIA
jgi:hypothetical protein